MHSPHTEEQFDGGVGAGVVGVGAGVVGVGAGAGAAVVGVGAGVVGVGVGAGAGAGLAPEHWLWSKPSGYIWDLQMSDAGHWIV